MAEVSTFRLYLLRATYAFMFLGLALTIWPLWGQSSLDTEVSRTVVRSMLTAVSLLALVGIRYPLQMLPVMLFEMIWKAIWLALVALPRVAARQVDAATSESIFACGMGIIIPIVIPWGYVWAHYVRRPSDRWKAAAVPAR